MTDSGGTGSGSSSTNIAALKSLKAKRSQIKGQCTRAATYLNTLDAQGVSLIELRQRLHKFNESWDIFNGVQSAIEEIETSADDTANHDEERHAFEERYFAISSELEALLEAKLGSRSSVSLSQISRQVREGTPASFGGSNDHLKLPRVNLPTFSGEFEEWIPFRNMFRSMVDQNVALPKGQKMQYLILALRGEARDIIDSLISDKYQMTIIRKHGRCLKTRTTIQES
ncbi:hypothetical protein ALC62_01818 [Cyphomyrmex costatus]|uniref:Uncharacterized protein n=1 Tax=Cyphomyrmex costatus TaxID=456900 RepID=A0A151IPF2_9HYME|nr:hypothetical protein ALC62_01818 [Cyphomyrmex costatus]